MRDTSEILGSLYKKNTPSTSAEDILQGTRDFQSSDVKALQKTI